MSLSELAPVGREPPRLRSYSRKALPWRTAGAYLGDSVLNGQLLPLHTFIEGEDESDVVGICLSNRGEE